MCTYPAFWTYKRLFGTYPITVFWNRYRWYPIVEGIYVLESREISLLEAEGKGQRVGWRCNCAGSKQSCDADMIDELHLECWWRKVVIYVLDFLRSKGEVKSKCQICSTSPPDTLYISTSSTCFRKVFLNSFIRSKSVRSDVIPSHLCIPLDSGHPPTSRKYSACTPEAQSPWELQAQTVNWVPHYTHLSVS